ADTNLTSELTNRMIEKATKAVKKHSILIRGVEYVKFIDDAYLLMGKGLFYQRHYSKARMVFNFVLSEFPKNPERYEAMLWIAKTYIQEGEFEMAIGLINKVEAQQASLNQSTEKELPLVKADYFLALEQYDQAVPYLKAGLALVTKNSDLKARINFILGQLEQKKRRTQSAYDYYQACLKLNPPLAMVFNARLNMALCYDKRTMDGKDILKALQKMLNDSKNATYFGRIYYVMGEIAFKEGREKDAISCMDKSIAASEGDPERMLLAAKRLSAYFYGKRQYLESQKYYEIAAKVVKAEDEEYYTISSRSKNLAELMKYYKNLTYSDTLRMISNMSDAEKKQYASKKVAEYKKKKEIENLAKSQGGAQTDANTPGTSNWYFYNTQSRNMGLAEFTKKWGKRKLEDLWFLSSKPPMAALRSMESDGRNPQKMLENEITELSPEDPAYYLQNLPNSVEKFKTLDSIIELSLFQVGIIYYDKLDEDKEGEKYLLRFTKDYPTSNHISTVWENLCKIYHQRGDALKFRQYADLLAKNYPGSEQDQRVNNPNYYKEMENNAKRIEQLYEQAYLAFSRDQYSQVLTIVDQVNAKYPINVLKAQFLYIEAIATAYIKGYGEMIPLLENFMASYPEHELIPRVEAMLAKAKRDFQSNLTPQTGSPLPVQEVAKTENLVRKDKDGSEAVVKLPVTEYKPAKNTAVHFVVLLVKKDKINPEVLKIKLSDFNRKFYSENSLTTTIEPFNAAQLSFTIADFPNEKTAMSYYKAFINNDYIFSSIAKEDRMVFVITVDNLSLLKKSMDSKAYQIYFEKNYLNK
ncbi:MAG: tetratricopeptide repeat protein, partial [Bacteroidales bacterium]